MFNFIKKNKKQINQNNNQKIKTNSGKKQNKKNKKKNNQNSEQVKIQNNTKFINKSQFNNSLTDNKIYFCPIGGIGKIGGNMYLYGYKGKWIIVDCGIAFADEAEYPGVDLLMPDPEFIYSIKDKILGLFLTHTHEDHFGAIPYIIPNLPNCPIYGTPFALGMVENKLRDSNVVINKKITMKRIEPFDNKTIKIGPFTIEYINITHSMPEANMLALHFDDGIVLHTGDFKFDDNPMIGYKPNYKAIKNLAKQNVLAVISDSTNALEKNHSLSEKECRDEIIKVVKDIKTGNIVFTCFATSIAVMETAYLAAKAAGLKIAIIGRSMIRNFELAQSCGYLKDVKFLSQEEAMKISGRKMYLITGTQGESRSVMTRVANDAYAGLKLNKGDTAIFSSSIVPGNEKDVFAVFNELSKIGVHIIYRANNKLIHASGHGSAVELAELYNMVKPKALIPMHGEAIHLLENERVGRDCGIKNTLVIENGQVVSISNTNKVIEHIGNVPVGEIAVDGNLQVKTSNSVFKDRKKLNYNGVAFISAVIDRKAKLQDDTEITFIGVSDNPQIQVLKSEIKKSIRDSIDRLSKKEKSDKTRLKDVIEACARTLIRDYTDKKVQCTVHLTIK